MIIQDDSNIIQFYLDNGLTPIPVYPQTKTPCLPSWKQYQDFKPSKEEIAEWFRIYWNPNYWRTNTYIKAKWIQERRKALLAEKLTPDEINAKPELLEYDGSISVAILGGKTSGNLVIFDDDKNALTHAELEKFKETTLVIQTKSGYHIYIRMFNQPESTKDGEKGELRGEGAYVIAPPSTHVLGFKYEVISSVTTIKKLDNANKDKEFLEYAKEKLIFKDTSTANPINTVIQGNNVFLYAWHKRFIENFFAEDHLNELALKLFAPSIAKSGYDVETGADIILSWAEKCHQTKGAALTVDKAKIVRMIESAKANDITPMSKDGLKKRHPELYKQLLEQGVVTEQEPSNEASAFVNGKGVFKTALVAQYLHNNEHFKTDRVTNKMFYGDTKTCKWNRQGENKVQELVTNILGQEDRESHYKNVLHTLKSLTFEDIVLSKKLALENGNLDPETQEFSKPSLDEFIYYQLPVTYNPTVDPHKLDNWLEFLKQVTNPEDIPFLQEWSGYLLLPDYRFQFALWIHGEGRNGKGVYDRTMKGILGKKNVCARGIEELDGTHRFSLQHYYGKLYAVSSEPVTNKIFRTEIFQALTGSDTVQAEVKNGNSLLDFVNCAKLTVIGNQFPKIHNPTKAFKERMKFIEFPTFFSENERIPDLENVWLNDPEQKTAIFNWMLEGLNRLLSQGHFTQGKTQKETEILFQRTSDSLTAFITEMAIFDKILTTTRKDAYEAYKNYCDVLGLYAVNEQLFTAKLKQTPHVTVTTVSHPSKLRAWKGIGFKLMDDDGKVSAVSEVSPLILSPIYQSHLKEGEKDGERVNGDTVDTSDTLSPENSALGESEVTEKYEQKNLELKIKLTKDGQPCLSCGQVASEYEIESFKNGELECVFYNCKPCLFEKTIPEYKAQGARIDLATPEPTEEDS